MFNLKAFYLLRYRISIGSNATCRDATTGAAEDGRRRGYITACASITTPSPTSDDTTFIAVQDFNVCGTVIPRY